MSKAVAKSFHATLERCGPPLYWVIIRVPFSVPDVWGRRGQLKVKGEMNGVAFRSSLFPRGGQHIMIVNKGMQAEAGVAPGTVAEFRLAPDAAPRDAPMPPELERVVRGERALRRWYDELNYSTRKEIRDWISQPKHAEARVRRAEQIAVRLVETMEAERELPPLFEAAFKRQPRAGEGWQRMSAATRRRHLLAIFYYRTPQARARRLEKALQEAARLAEKLTRKRFAS
jgi:uncharacterized protein YdeI (YjbR/CyaY-like superfamily)